MFLWLNPHLERFTPSTKLNPHLCSSKCPTPTYTVGLEKPGIWPSILLEQQRIHKFEYSLLPWSCLSPYNFLVILQYLEIYSPPDPGLWVTALNLLS